MPADDGSARGEHRGTAIPGRAAAPSEQAIIARRRKAYLDRTCFLTA